LGSIKIYVKIYDMQFLNERVSAIRIGGRSAVLAKCAVKPIFPESIIFGTTVIVARI